MTYMDESFFHFAFSSFVGIGPVRFDALIRHFGTVEKAYHASEKSLAMALGNKLAKDFVDFRSGLSLEKSAEYLEKAGVTLVARCDKKYPQGLNTLTDRPICLYVKGDIAKYDFSSGHFFGIVGTRKPTTYGSTIARKFGRELAQAGFVIVSGMALGIDSEAHRGALEAGGKTIAVLGCGVNVVYPPANQKLYDDILASEGLIVSEFPPDRTVMKGLFVSRNRIIAALSRATMVVEGLKNSGSLVTARCALDLGKDVFAPPAPITSIQSEAPNMLLKSGAVLVTSVDDILEELSMAVMPAKSQNIAQMLNEEEILIFELLQNEPLAPDELARRLLLPIQTILNLISTMEIRGYVKRNVNGTIQICL